MRDFSQFGEQAIILKYFNGHVGTALSCGENDGEFLSNVRALILLEFGAVLVEPSPTPFAKLKALYEGNPAVTCINAAICDHDGVIDLWDSGTHLNKGDTALLSTTIEHETEKWKASTSFNKIQCRAMTVATLLAECGQTQFDMISIDTEGQDYAILRQMDLTAMGCRLLCVETNGIEPEKYVAYARGHGMRLLHRHAVNLIFAR